MVHWSLSPGAVILGGAVELAMAGLTLALSFAKLETAGYLVGALIVAVPPYNDYEFAVRGVMAARRVPGGIRPEIVTPVVTPLDAVLVLMLVLHVVRRRQAIKLGGRSVAVLACEIAMLAIAAVSSLAHLPGANTLQLAAGMGFYWRLLLGTALGLVVLSYDADRGTRREWRWFELGVAAALIQSLFITHLRNGTILPGQQPYNGIVPGPGTVAALLVASAALLVGCSHSEVSAHSRRCALPADTIVAVVTCMAYVLLTLTRSAIVAGLALLLVVWMKCDAWARRQMAAFGVPVLSALAIWISHGSYARVKISSAVSTGLMSRSNLGPRVNLWRTALSLLRSSPWLGIGPGMWNAVSGSQQAVHSLYVGAGLDTGLIGMLLLLAVLGVAVMGVFERGRWPFAMGVLSLGIIGLTSPAISNNRVVLLLGFLIAGSVVRRQTSQA